MHTPLNLGLAAAQMLRQSLPDTKWRTSPQCSLDAFACFSLHFRGARKGPRFGSASVEIARVDSLAGQSQLQHFHVFRSVKHFTGEKSLGDHSNPSECHAHHQGKDTEHDGSRKYIFE